MGTGGCVGSPRSIGSHAPPSSFERAGSGGGTRTNRSAPWKHVCDEGGSSHLFGRWLATEVWASGCYSGRVAQRAALPALTMHGRSVEPIHAPPPHTPTVNSPLPVRG